VAGAVDAPPSLQQPLVLFLHACLEASPLHTITACRDLHLWPTLLGSVALPRRAGLMAALTTHARVLEAASPADAGLQRYTVVVEEGGQPVVELVRAWLRVQDLALELLHKVGGWSPVQCPSVHRAQPLPQPCMQS
jgi:hypothetical protein